MLCVVIDPIGDGHDLDLNGSEPSRERTGKVLGDNADKAFYRAEHDTVDHDGTVLFAVGADILKLKTLGKLHVKLDSAALPGTAE